MLFISIFFYHFSFVSIISKECIFVSFLRFSHYVHDSWMELKGTRFAGFSRSKNERQTGQRTHATDHQVQKALDRDSGLVFSSPAESDRLLAGRVFRANVRCNPLFSPTAKPIRYNDHRRLLLLQTKAPWFRQKYFFSDHIRNVSLFFFKGSNFFLLF